MSETPLGRFCWYELLTTDLEGAQEFYRQVVGWETGSWEGEGPPYITWINAGTPIGGVMTLPDNALAGGVPPHWLPYISTPDVDATAEKAARLGGQVHHRMELPDIGRLAIMADPNFQGGDYYDGPPPARGLAVARMVGHITYMSDESMREKFGRRRRADEDPSDEFAGLFAVESYLRYRGGQFVNRFDANSYLCITRAMDSIDLSAGHGSFSEALAHTAARFLVVSFTSDWLYPSYQSQEIVRALRGRNLDVTYVELPSNHGHDAFLVEVGELTELVKSFLDNTFRKVESAVRPRASAGT